MDDPDPHHSTRINVRNNLIGYFETASSSDLQREYERKVPIAQVPVEMIVQWEDWVNHSDLDWYCEPVFSRDERDAIEAFHEVWRGVAQDVPDPMPYTVEQLIGTPVWQRLMDAAGVAREVFVRRGRFDDVT